jgi:hypothetical protein
MKQYFILFGVGGNAAPRAIPDGFQLFGEGVCNSVVETEINQPEHAAEQAVRYDGQIQINDFLVINASLYHLAHYGKRLGRAYGCNRWYEFTVLRIQHKRHLRRIGFGKVKKMFHDGFALIMGGSIVLPDCEKIGCNLLQKRIV